MRQAKINYQKGNIVIIILFIIEAISFVMASLSQSLSQSITANQAIDDYRLAKHYAQLALIEAENVVYQLQCPNDNCNNGFANTTSVLCNEFQQDAVKYRTCILDNIYHMTAFAKSCNSNNQWKGFCGNFSADMLFPFENPPYLQTSTNFHQPCDSYDVALNEQEQPIIPTIDDKNSLSSRIFYSKNNELCAQPRYQIEFIDLDYQSPTTPVNHIDHENTSVHTEKTDNQNSAILYRITVRSFGQNGNNRVTLQEYMFINNSSERLTLQRVVRISQLYI